MDGRLIIFTDGPDVVTIIPPDTSVSGIEGHILHDITCSSDCYPSCRQIWKNDTSNKIIEPQGTLSLGNVSRYFTGTYTCTVSNEFPDLTTSKKNSIHVTIKCKYTL